MAMNCVIHHGVQRGVYMGNRNFTKISAQCAANKPEQLRNAIHRRRIADAETNNSHVPTEFRRPQRQYVCLGPRAPGEQERKRNIVDAPKSTPFQ
jgi:hypothetical protein